MEKKWFKEISFFMILIIMVAITLCSCSKEKNNDNLSSKEKVIIDVYSESITESEKNNATEQVNGTEDINTTVTTTTRTAYVVGAVPIGTADGKKVNVATTVQTAVVQTTTVNKVQEIANVSKTKVANVLENKTKGNELPENVQFTSTTTANYYKNTTVKSVAIQDTKAQNVSTTSQTTTTTMADKVDNNDSNEYIPNFYLEKANVIDDSSSIENYAEIFKASATMWFDSDAELNKVYDTVKLLDYKKLLVGDSFDFNEYLQKNSINVEDETAYFASVLLFESSRAADMKINENTFPELQEFYEGKNRLSRNSENLILTNDTNKPIVFYIYVNKYSWSITVSCYITS